MTLNLTGYSVARYSHNGHIWGAGSKYIELIPEESWFKTI